MKPLRLIVSMAAVSAATAYANTFNHGEAALPNGPAQLSFPPPLTLHTSERFEELATSDADDSGLHMGYAAVTTAIAVVAGTLAVVGAENESAAATAELAPAPGISAATSVDRSPSDITGLVNALKAQPLFRGLMPKGYMATLTDGTQVESFEQFDKGRTLQALKNIQAQRKAFMPVMWGFRVFDPNEGLTLKETNTIDAYAEMARSLEQTQGITVNAPLLLADIHAEHNEIPPEIYQPYYAAVEQAARQRGVSTIRLSEIYRELGITLKEIEDQGASLVQKFGPPFDPSAPTALITLPERYWAHLKQQAIHTVDRFPSAFEKMSSRKKAEYCGPKAQKYAQFRAAEADVLARFSQLRCADGAPVLVANVADEESIRIGVGPLYIHAMDPHNTPVKAIPWGAESRKPTNPSGTPQETKNERT